MSNSDLKYFGNIRNRKTTGKWPLKYFVNCQHSLTEHEAWQQLPGHIGQEPYAKPRLTESHIFSVEIFPMVCLSLSPRLYSAAHMVLHCPDHRDEDSSCLCDGASVFVTPVCVGGVRSSQLQLSSPALAAVCGRNWDRQSSSPDNCFVWAETDSSAFTDNETMNGSNWIFNADQRS